MSKHSQSGPWLVRSALCFGAAAAIGALGACGSDTSAPHYGNLGSSASGGGSGGGVSAAGATSVAGGGSTSVAGAATAGSSSSTGGTGGSGDLGGSGGAAPGGAGASGGSGGGSGGSGGSSGGGSSADCSTFKLCDNFEGDAPGMGKSPWKVTQGNGYTVVVDTTQAHSGTHSVHISAPIKSGSGVLRETTTFPATEFWGRAFMRFKTAPANHQMFIAVIVQGDQFRLLNTLGSNAVRLNEQNGDQFFASKTNIPMETWFCYEWHVTATGASVYMDGKELTDAAPTGWKIANEQSLQIGYQRFQDGTSAGEIWLDDIAINDKQIGCQ